MVTVALPLPRVALPLPREPRRRYLLHASVFVTLAGGIQKVEKVKNRQHKVLFQALLSCVGFD